MPQDVKVILIYTIPGNIDQEAFDHFKQKLYKEVHENTGVEKLLENDWMLLME